MNRYQTIGPLTTASVPGGGSTQINIDAALAGFALPASFNIVKAEIVPNVSSAYDARVYVGAAYAPAQRLIRWEGHTGNTYYPIDRTDNGYAEGLEGWPIPYDEAAGLEVLHFEIENDDTSAHTYTYTFTIEEVPIFSAVGDVAFRGNLKQPAGAYHNWGATVGTLGYGIRDNAGSIEFKHSGGAWAALGSSGVTSIIGTANQVIASSPTGAVTLSLPQSIGLTSSPTFASLNAATIGPSGAQQHTLPAIASDTVVLLAAAQAFTNKTISGATNTLSAIGNASLANSSLIVTAGTGMSGGGVVSLGGAVTLTNTGVTSAIGTANQITVSGATGAVTFSLPQSIAAASTPTFAGLTLTAPLTVANGGTGVATLAANGVLYGNAAGVVLVTAQGPANSVLTANAGAPSFSATPTLTTLTLTSTLGVSGLATLSAGINTGTSQAINSTTSRLEQIGGVTIGTWNATGLGIGGTPTSRLHLLGNMSAAAWGVTGLAFRSAAATYTDTSSTGTVASVVLNSFGIPTLVASSATTFTDAATVYIAGVPVASTNVTITNPYALYVAAGNVYFGAQVRTAGGSAATPAFSSLTYPTTGAYFTAGPTYNIAVNGANAVAVATGSFAFVNTTSNVVYFGTTGTAVPGAGSLGQKIQIYGSVGTVGATDYAVGIEGGHLWFNGSSYKWYSSAVEKARLDLNGRLILGGVSIGDGLTNILTLNGDTPGVDFNALISGGGARAWYSAGRIYGAFNSTGYTSSRLTFATATGSGTFVDTLSLIGGNVGIGTATFGTSATKTLALFNGVEPSTSPADTLQIYSVDLSAGNATLGIRTETAVAVDAALVSTHSLSVRINGVTRKLMLA